MPEKDDQYIGPDRSYVEALLLGEVVRRILKKRGNIFISRHPDLKRVPITSFIDRMRISGLSKFDERTYIATINFYRNDKDMAEHRCAGAIIVYIPESQIEKIIRALDYPIHEDDDIEAIMLDACGTFCNLIAGNFRQGLRQLGYKDLMMSHFSTYINTVVDGVEYDPSETNVYEISFEIHGIKSIVVDLTLGEIENENDIKTWSYFD